MIDTDVGVVDHQVFVSRFALHQPQLGDLVVDGRVAGAVKQADLPLWKIPHQFLDYRHTGIALVCCAENEFVFGIVLAAKTGKVFMSFRVEPPNRFQIADAGVKSRFFSDLSLELQK